MHFAKHMKRYDKNTSLIFISVHIVSRYIVYILLEPENWKIHLSTDMKHCMSNLMSMCLQRYFDLRSVGRNKGPERGDRDII